MFDLFERNGVFYIVEDEVKRLINIWLKETGLKKGSFGVVLEKLGFNKDKVLYLSRCSDNFDKIILKYGDSQSKINDMNTITLLYNNDIELKHGDIKDRYVCRYDREVDGKIDLRYKFSLCEKNKNGVSYFRNIINGIDSTINISVEDKKINQGINIDIKFDDMFYSTYNIYNEEELQNYLMNLSYPISISDVYFNVCRILGNEMEVYDEIRLNNYTVNDLSPLFNSVLKYDRKYGYESTEVVSFDEKVGYVRERYDSKVEIRVKNGDYKFYLEVDFNEIDEFGKKLDNEIELQKYLMNLEFPISIEEVYKKICEISLGDVSKYSRIVLQCCDNSKNGMITDMIVLSDGNFEKFGMTKDGITVFIDKNDNFTYRTDDVGTGISLNIMGDDKLKCELSADNDKYMKDYMESLFLYDIGDAKKEKENTKKLVRKIFYNK